ncbi:MAG TPA: hypothetical protein VKQ08_02440 [Cyclobacteriaceae bacterium]|nr:hypothetical protein [Cyclobacteriaceae bacterium]
MATVVREINSRIISGATNISILARCEMQTWRATVHRKIDEVSRNEVGR